MLKSSFFVTTLLATSLSAAAVAHPHENTYPVCYMDMGGLRTDLTSMCGDGSEPLVAATVNESAVVDDNLFEEQPILRNQDLASFQVIRIARDGQATGRVNFVRSAPMGTTVNPYVRFADGSRSYVGTATRTRGQSRVEIDFRLPAGTTTSEVEGGII